MKYSNLSLRLARVCTHARTRVCKAMNSKESKLTKDIRDYLHSEGWLSWKNHGTQFSEAGLPDVMAVKESKFIALEIKTATGKATVLQERWIQKLKAQGVAAGVVRCVGDVEQLLRAPA